MPKAQRNVRIGASKLSLKNGSTAIEKKKKHNLIPEDFAATSGLTR